MVERALQVLSLHIIWKARHFMRAQDSSDKEQMLDALREQRDVLLEKLVEYAVGTQSNTLLGVRRAVRHFTAWSLQASLIASTGIPNSTDYVHSVFRGS